MHLNQSETPMLVGLYGYMGSGKTTVAEIMRDECGYRVVGFADPLKELAYRVGWDGTKRPHKQYGYFGKGAYNGRLLLQELGVGARDILGQDVWVEALFRRIENTTTPVVISDVRFRNEAEAIRAKGGHLVRVMRRGFEGDGHPSETEVPRIAADAFIHNDRDAEHLRSSVADVLRFLSAP